jgi:8-oxo-dGTP pyrophosphatase MutT (NUDIX family)
MRAVDASVNVPSAATPNPSDSPSDTPSDPAVEVRDAATVILVADRPDLHVLMLERTRRAVFGPGATVFPGGAVDAADRDARSRARVVGLDDAGASADQGIAAGGLGFRIAALRECFEEAGILLARDARTGNPVDHDADLATARERLNAGAVTFAEVLETRDLVLEARDLRVFSHWLTPVGSPRRYNTWFFVACAPDGEDGAHDDNELVASGWVRPVDALAQHVGGDIDLIFPTEMSLRALTRYLRTSELFADLDAVPRDERGRLRVIADGTGERVALPADAARPTGPWTIPLPDISFRAERAVAARKVGE